MCAVGVPLFQERMKELYIAARSTTEQEVSKDFKSPLQNASTTFPKSKIKMCVCGGVHAHACA